MKLNEIEHNISQLMQHYSAAREHMAGSDIPIINQINRHILSKKGKQLRPLLTLISACCCGLSANAEANHPVFYAAAAIETLHTSTLVHDDVIDNSDIRRGTPTVNKLWNNKTAVLMGDFYLAQVMKTINDIDNKRLTTIVNDTVILMSEGELLQQQLSGNYNIAQADYLQIINRKTAALIAACCEAGATLAGASDDICIAARQFGENLGTAFQIRDDIIDFLPSQRTGKPQGNDILEHKCTLPIILALNDVQTRKQLLPLLENEFHSSDEVAAIIGLVTDGGFLAKATDILHHRLDTTAQCLLPLPDNTYRQYLNEIVALLKEI